MEDHESQIHSLMAELERQRHMLRRTQSQLAESVDRLRATVEDTRRSVVTFYTAIGEVDAHFVPRLTPSQYEQVVSLVSEPFDTPAEVLSWLNEVTPLWNVEVSLRTCL